MLEVNLIRQGRTEQYDLKCPFDSELVEKIKVLPSDQRSFNKHSAIWTLNAKAISNLINLYKGRKDVSFIFENDKQRTQFINIVNKHRAAAEKKRLAEEEMIRFDEYILDVKKNLPSLVKNLDISSFMKEGVTPYPFQIEGAFFASKLTSGILAMDLGTGKCQKLTSNILTPFGYKLMGDIQVNDDVINSQGKVSKVTGIFPQGEKDFYKVYFSDNTFVECCDEHLWTVQTSNHKKRNHGWFTYSLRELIDKGISMKCGNSMSKWFIPLVKPIEFEKKDLYIHPYLMGALLGDGGFSGRTTTFTSIDEEIINNIISVLPKNHFIKLKKNNLLNYTITSDIQNFNGLKRELNKLNLKCTSHHKFIPDIYKYSSVIDRIELLQGLMDTDGTVDYRSGHHISYTSVSRQLIDDISFIVQSLGGTCKIRKQKIDKKGFKSWNCTISLIPEILPFKLKRKADVYKPKSKYPPYRMIRKVEYIGKGEGQCISVSALDQLYLTDNCVVTHNTITSLLACQLNPDVKKVLCIVPASLKLNWQDEVHKFTNEQAYVVKMVKGKLSNYKRNDGIDINKAKYIILNYDYFNATKFDFNTRIRDIGLRECDTIIFDEAHKLGYKSSNTTKNITTAFKDIINRRLLLTGTPIKNKLTQLFPILKIVKPFEFSNESKYFIEYCGLFYGDYGWQPTGKPPKLEELNSRLDTLMYRVRKEDVLKDLPDMIRIKVNVEMDATDTKNYLKIKHGISKYIAETDTMVDLTEDDDKSAIVIIGRLRQFTASLKVKQVLELIEDINSDGEKVVVFDNFKKPLKQLKEKLGVNSELYTGEQSVDERQALVNKFQDTDSNLQNLLISLAAGNAGITLTAAKNLILITQSYVPSENEQAFARIHRIGQKNAVNIFIFVVDETIDMSIYNLIGNKQQMISKVIDNIDYEDTATNSILADLLKEFSII